MTLGVRFSGVHGRVQGFRAQSCAGRLGLGELEGGVAVSSVTKERLFLSVFKGLIA